MAEKNRFDIKTILGDPDLRRRLMVSTIQATQAREGIVTTEGQAHKAYYVVTEHEKTAFLDLQKFNEGKGRDRRHDVFVRMLIKPAPQVRYDVPRKDFQAIDGSPLNYRSVGVIAHVFRESSSLEPSVGVARQGKASGDDPRWVRQWWECVGLSGWVPFAKGGEFSRFYADLDLVIDWRPTSRADLKASGNGLPSEDLYFKQGITWPLAAGVFNARLLPSGAVFAHKGPVVIPLREHDTSFLNGLLNSAMALYLLKVFTTREEMGGRWEVGIIKKLPIPEPAGEHYCRIGDGADAIYRKKSAWDQGNEVSTRFQVPWLIRETGTPGKLSIAGYLDQILEFEQLENQSIQHAYAELDEEVYRFYRVPAEVQETIKVGLGRQPAEVIWPQMEGKTLDQKRMEHVWRLLAFAVNRVVNADRDGVLPLQQVSGEAQLLDRVRSELGKMFPGRDINEVEVEIVNELRRKVKGYGRTESIREWLEDAFFEYHSSLYKNRPIFWHISSKQGKGPAAFSALVHYHRFDKDRIAKLRGVYLREALATFRREAALASQVGRAEDRLEWQAKVEEAEEFDRRLQKVQEGFHQGSEDFRILPPWKTENQRPKGWDPDVNDGVKVNIEPLQRAGVLRIPEVV